MPKPLPIPEGAAEKLRLELKKSRTKEHYRRALAVWMRVALGMPSHEIARVLDCSPETAGGWRRHRRVMSAIVPNACGAQYRKNPALNSTADILRHARVRQPAKVVIQ